MRPCSAAVGISCASPDSSPFGVVYSHLQTHLGCMACSSEVPLLHRHFAPMQVTAQGAGPRAASPRSGTFHSWGQDTAWEEAGRGRSAPSLHGELQQSRGAEGCGVLHRGGSAPRSEGRISFPFQAELSPGPSKDTWWQSQLLGAKPPVPSAHQMDAHVPERADITLSTSLPLRESNVAPNCAMLQSRDPTCPLHQPAQHGCQPGRPVYWTRGRLGPKENEPGWAGGSKGLPGCTQKWGSVKAAGWA